MKKREKEKIERENKGIRIKGKGNNPIRNIKDNGLNLNVSATCHKLCRGKDIRNNLDNGLLLKRGSNKSILNIKDNNSNLNVASTCDRLKRGDNNSLNNKKKSDKLINLNKLNNNLTFKVTSTGHKVKRINNNSNADNFDNKKSLNVAATCHKLKRIDKTSITNIKGNNSSLNVSSTCPKLCGCKDNKSITNIKGNNLTLNASSTYNQLKRSDNPQFRIISLILIFLFSSLALLSTISTASAVDYTFQNSSGANLTIIYGSNGNLTAFGNISAVNFNSASFSSTYNATYDASPGSSSSTPWQSASGIIYNNTKNVKVGIGNSTPVTLLHVVSNNNSLNASYFYQNVSLNKIAYAGKFENFVDGGVANGPLVYLGYFDGNRNYSIYSDRGINYFEGETIFNHSVKIMSGSHLGIGINNESSAGVAWGYGAFKLAVPPILTNELTIRAGNNNTFGEVDSAWTGAVGALHIGMVNSSYMDNYGISFWNPPNAPQQANQVVGHISGTHNKTTLNTALAANGGVRGEILLGVNGSFIADINATYFSLSSNASGLGMWGYGSYGINVTLNGGAHSKNATEMRWCDGSTIAYDTGIECCAFYNMSCLETWGDAIGGDTIVDMHQRCNDGWGNTFIALCY